MISFDEKKLERVLYEVLEKEYSYAETYLELETVEFDLISPEEPATTFYAKGHYGITKGAELVWSRQFDLLLDIKWSWDFIAGYFCRQILLDDEEQQYETSD